MSNATLTSLVATSSARSSRTPHFSGGEVELELLFEFLRKYNDLADGFGLTEE